MKKKRNPLSYLGWLGLLGVLGLFLIPMFIPFLLFFSFFSYANVVPDELFWKNVNRAAARGFWSVFTFNVVMAGVVFIRAMRETFWSDNIRVPVTIEGDIVTMGCYTVGQYYIVFLTFFISLILMVLVFTISMMRFKKQEKRLLEEDSE